MATTEMRLALIHIVDAALTVAPLVRPTLLVDDLSAEASGGPNAVVKKLSAFTLKFCNGVTEELMEI